MSFVRCFDFFIVINHHNFKKGILNGSSGGNLLVGIPPGDDTPLTDKNLVKLELLSNLVADYDEAHYPIKTPSLAEVLKLKMYEKDLTQTMLSEIIGVSPSHISEYLTGKGEPTLKVTRTICVKLDVSPY